MNGRITDYRQGRHTQKDNQGILEVDGVDSKEKAEALVGKEIHWKSSAGRLIKGHVTGSHGAKGKVRALFDKGLPGQAIGSKVELK